MCLCYMNITFPLLSSPHCLISWIEERKGVCPSLHLLHLFDSRFQVLAFTTDSLVVTRKNWLDVLNPRFFRENYIRVTLCPSSQLILMRYVFEICFERKCKLLLLHRGRKCQLCANIVHTRWKCFCYEMGEKLEGLKLEIKLWIWEVVSVWQEKLSKHKKGWGEQSQISVISPHVYVCNVSILCICGAKRVSVDRKANNIATETGLTMCAGKIHT